MSTASTISWPGNCVPFRRRADLEARPSFSAPTKAWLVKDPVALRYFELPEEEHFLWQLLDGRRTWGEVTEAYERAFKPRQLDVRRLTRLLERLHEQGLVTSERTGQGTVLRRRGRRTSRRKVLARLANPLAIRLPGFDPSPILAWLKPLTAPMFTPICGVVCAVLCVAAIVTALTHFAELQRETATALRFPSFNELPYWLAAIGLAKIIHELAHAVTCRRYGGECREMGVLLLCGAPSLYCDVTSMWMTPERWKRVAVGAAGMIAELVLAAVALLIWRFTHPGRVHDLALYTAVACSVSTIVVNANPLLRYDGYFILADLLGIVNLAEQASAALRSITTEWFFGESADDSARTPTRFRHRLALFAVASAVYRWVLTLAVLWWVRRTLAPHGLAVLADLLAVVSIGALAMEPIRGSMQIVREQRARGWENRRRAFIRLGGVLLIVAALLAWPWPHSVDAPAVVRLRDAEYVYVVVGGTLVEAAAPGSRVSPDDVLAKLVDRPLELEAERLSTEVARRKLEIQTLERRRVADPVAGESLPQAAEQLKAVEKQWRHAVGEQARLTIRAAREGIVIPLFDKRDAAAANEDAALTSALAPERRGDYLPAGTPLCAVGDPARLTAELYVEQGDVDAVHLGQMVRLRFDAAPDRTIEGTVAETAEVASAEVPAELRIKLPEWDDDRRQSVRRRTLYVVRVDLPADAGRLPIGSFGQAKIEAAPQSFAERIRRWSAATIRFDWNAP